MANFKRHMEFSTHAKKSTDVIDEDIPIDSYKKKIFCCDICETIYLSKQALKNTKSNAYQTQNYILGR
jgi:hypothetical protein